MRFLRRLVLLQKTISTVNLLTIIYYIIFTKLGQRFYSQLLIRQPQSYIHSQTATPKMTVNYSHAVISVYQKWTQAEAEIQLIDFTLSFAWLCIAKFIKIYASSHCSSTSHIFSGNVALPYTISMQYSSIRLRLISAWNWNLRDT